MKAELTKDFDAMLHDNKNMPKIQIITDSKTIKNNGGKRMLLVPPLYYQTLIKLIPEGMIVTTKSLRTYWAKKLDADFTDPMTAGIFVNIVAWASYQTKDMSIPYWRVLKSDGELNSKYPEGINLQKSLLEKEGHEIIVKGTKHPKYYVINYLNKEFTLDKSIEKVDL